MRLAKNGKGKEITIQTLADIFIKQQEKGAHNINVVTPTMYAYQIKEAIKLAREKGLKIPIIYNSNGYEKVQTLKDLRRGRRSEWHRIEKGFIEPTLKDCVAGDLALVLPHRIITNILEGLEKLDKIMPGVNNDETLLYGPEIKFFSNEISTNNNFKLENDNIYFVGDGAGKAGNIVTAAATGLVSARDILNSIKK